MKWPSAVIVDPIEDVGDVLDRVDAGASAGDDERIERRELFASVLALHEEEFFPSESDQSERVFSRVVVQTDPRVVKEAPERSEILPGVARRAPKQRLRGVNARERS